MGMLYRQDIFDEYGIAVPTTWDEFAAAAQQLKDAGAPGVLVDFPTNGRAYNQALFAQAGSVPFDYDNANPTEIGIDVNDQGAKDVLAYWEDLVDEGPRRDRRRVHGRLQHQARRRLATRSTSPRRGARATSAACRMPTPTRSGRPRPFPQWDAANPVQINWGGSTFAVTSQAKDPELSALVAKEIFGTEEAWKIGIEEARAVPAVEADPRVRLLPRPGVPVLRRSADQQGRVPPGGVRLHRLHLQPVPELRVRPAHRAAVRDGPGREGLRRRRWTTSRRRSRSTPPSRASP